MAASKQKKDDPFVVTFEERGDQTIVRKSNDLVQMTRNNLTLSQQRLILHRAHCAGQAHRRKRQYKCQNADKSSFHDAPPDLSSARYYAARLLRQNTFEYK